MDGARRGRGCPRSRPAATCGGPRTARSCSRAAPSSSARTSRIRSRPSLPTSRTLRDLGERAMRHRHRHLPSTAGGRRATARSRAPATAACVTSRPFLRRWVWKGPISRVCWRWWRTKRAWWPEPTAPGTRLGTPPGRGRWREPIRDRLYTRPRWTRSRDATRYLLLAVLGAGAFLSGLELMITAVALPAIVVDLADWTALRAASWIINGYLLVSIVSCRWPGSWPTCGARGGCSSSALVVFIVGLDPGRAAPTPRQLIAARLVQAVGGGGLVPVGDGGRVAPVRGRRAAARARARRRADVPGHGRGAVRGRLDHAGDPSRRGAVALGVDPGSLAGACWRPLALRLLPQRADRRSRRSRSAGRPAAAGRRPAAPGRLDLAGAVAVLGRPGGAARRRDAAGSEPSPSPAARPGRRRPRCSAVVAVVAVIAPSCAACGSASRSSSRLVPARRPSPRRRSSRC